MTRCIGSNGIISVLCRIAELLNYVVPVLIALGVVYFVWGVVQYVIGGGEEAKTSGRNHIIAGLIGLAVILAMWGLAFIIIDSFGINDSLAPSNEYFKGLLPQ